MQALLDATTDLPWFRDWAEVHDADLAPGSGAVVFDSFLPADAEFIATAREHIRALLAEVHRQAAELADLRTRELAPHDAQNALNWRREMTEGVVTELHGPDAEATVARLEDIVDGRTPATTPPASAAEPDTEPSASETLREVLIDHVRVETGRMDERDEEVVDLLQTWFRPDTTGSSVGPAARARIIRQRDKALADLAYRAARAVSGSPNGQRLVDHDVALIEAALDAIQAALQITDRPSGGNPTTDAVRLNAYLKGREVALDEVRTVLTHETVPSVSGDRGEDAARADA
ncbi:hypothetical protein ACR8AM_14150 [Clavibacter sepedonicus]